MKHLIVNADDYAYTPGVSAGIRRAHREGIVTSTSVMMPMPHAQTALRTLKSESPSIGVGVHLTLTEGVPFRLPAFPSRNDLATALTEIPDVFIRDEWQAQIEAFLAAGLPLTHLDSHHHAAYRNRHVFGVLLDLARHYRVPVRNPYPINGMDAGFANRMFATSGVRHPARFLDVFDAIAPSADSLLKTLSVLDEGITEFMVHPGIVDNDLRRLCPTFAEPRGEELSALVDQRLRESMKELDILLVDFRALSEVDCGTERRVT